MGGTLTVSEWRRFIKASTEGGRGVIVIDQLHDAWCDRLRRLPVEVPVARFALVTSGDQRNLLQLKRFVIDEVIPAESAGVDEQVRRWAATTISAVVLAPLLALDLPPAVQRALLVLSTGATPHSLTRLAHLAGCVPTTLRRELATVFGNEIHWWELLGELSLLRMMALDPQLSVGKAASLLGMDFRTLRTHVRQHLDVGIRKTSRVGALDLAQLAHQLRTRFEAISSRARQRAR